MNTQFRTSHKLFTSSKFVRAVVTVVLTLAMGITGLSNASAAAPGFQAAGTISGADVVLQYDIALDTSTLDPASFQVFEVADPTTHFVPTGAQVWRGNFVLLDFDPLLNLDFTTGSWKVSYTPNDPTKDISNVGRTDFALALVDEPIDPTIFTAPAAPTTLVATAGDTQLSIAFTAGSNGGSAITDYEYTTDNGTHWTTAAVTASPVVITGLTNGTAYTVKIRAINAIGNGTASAAVTSTPTAAATAPAAPTTLVATAGDTQLSIAFTAGSNGGSAITDYEYTTDNGTHWTTAAVTASPVVITGLTNGTAYTVKIRAINAIGNGTASAAVTSTPTAAADTTPPALSATSASSVAATTATLNFTTDEAGTYYYLVYAAADTAPTASEVEAQGTAITKGTAATAAVAKTASVTGLTAETAYKAYVIVKDAAGNKSTVSTITFTTTAAPTPAPVVVSTPSYSAAEVAAIRAANDAAAKAEAEKIAAAKAVADAKVAAEAAAKAAADKAALEKAAAEREAADKAAAEVRAAAEAVVKAEEARVAAAEAQAAAVTVKPVVTKSGTKLTLDLPDKYYGKIVTIYVGTTVKGKTTYKKLDFFVLDKEDGTANITSKVKLVRGQVIRVNVGSTVVKSVKI